MTGGADIESLCARLHLDQISCRQFVEQCVRSASLSVGTSAAMLLLFDSQPADRSLRCVARYDRRDDAIAEGVGPRHAGAGPFMDALDAHRHVLTDDAPRCPSTRDLCRSSPFDPRVHALIATPFSLNGRLFGAFACIDDDPAARHSVQHLFLLRRISVRATLAMATALSNDWTLMMGRGWAGGGRAS